ncbi:ribonuclease K6-like [Octodon degus]|uniref:Ribonuclease K6 n=1 Tax=Octodon degus TaxID=10160 RepID=A0A6P3FCW8_OCTDE|nr:ribonuclease K6-like [Octodon degus]
MIAVNRPCQKCKPRNTFLHDSLQNVIDVCKQDTTGCSYGHRSVRPVRMTDCQLVGNSQFPNCHYTDTHITKNFIVTCDPPYWDDPQDPLVPVHLDKII